MTIGSGIDWTSEWVNDLLLRSLAPSVVDSSRRRHVAGSVSHVDFLDGHDRSIGCFLDHTAAVRV